ncbi:SDR family NAD(P)-dependent oxidoreductase [Actinomycetospora sp. CA-084318]|uniref:SDR family NAD(P)-dependent oxidoreductase n=1 Tax=Actinomycetospora sp. CA-084318 TaxID=3239892 RepID=UPI003D975531
MRPLAFVTGGSSGIGFELAQQLAQHGHDVVISGRADRVHDAAAALRGHGGEAWAVQVDLGTHEGVEEFWSFVAGLERPLEVACLNVGIGIGGAFADADLDAELELIAVNVTGTVHLAKRVVHAMLPQGRGRILVTSSISALQPTPYETVYGPSKAFGFSFAESLREELRESGISVTALLPGATNSEFHHTAGMDDTVFGDDSWKNDQAEVARQGYEALMRGDDHVIGGDDATRQQVEENRELTEVQKAEKHAAMARPS